MIAVDPFRRAATIALAWCLIGLGIDTGTDARPQSHAPSRRAAVGASGQFATIRLPARTDERFTDQADRPK